MAKVSWARTTPLATDEADVLKEGDGIKEGMTGNTNFAGTDTVALLTAFGTKLTAYHGAVDAWNAAGGGKSLTSAKVVARKAYLIALTALGRNVNSVVNVTTLSTAEKNAILKTSGFPLFGTNHTAQPLPQPTNLRAQYPQSGVLVVRVNKVPNARTYLWQYRESDQTPVAAWKTLDNFKTLTKVTLMAQNGDIASGKQYDFQVVGQGADPTENWSAIFTTDFIR